MKLYIVILITRLFEKPDLTEMISNISNGQEVFFHLRLTGSDWIKELLHDKRVCNGKRDSSNCTKIEGLIGIVEAFKSLWSKLKRSP